MHYGRLGKTALQVPKIGFGCARIGGLFSEKTSTQESIRLLQEACDAGITYFDTADMYTQGESERLLGRAFAQSRSKVVIASKVGYVLPARQRFVGGIKPLLKPIVTRLGIRRGIVGGGASGQLAHDFTVPYLFRAVERSLTRLRTDYLDLLQLHSPAPEVFRDEAVLRALETLKQQGKIRYFGVAAESVEDATVALQLPQLAVIQFPFGMLDLEALEAFLPQAEARGVGLIARGSFAAGLLSDSMTSQRLAELTPKAGLILAYRETARAHGRPLLEMALQFSMHFPAIAVTLLGMSSARHLEDNLKHFAAPRLTDAEVKAIIQASRHFAADNHGGLQSNQA